MMPDLVTFGETMLRLSPPEGERLETATNLEFRTAGAESNVAITASRLGAEPIWLSKLPDTALGRRVVGDLRRHGVATEIIWSDDGRQGTYYIEAGNSPRGTNVIYDRADAAITTTTSDELALEHIREAEIFYTSGITSALSSQLNETVSEVLADVARTGTTTAFDLNYRSKLWSAERAQRCYEQLLPQIDILIAAERDVRTVLQYEDPRAELAGRLRQEYGINTVVVTLGSDGAVAATPNGSYEQDAYETDTLDPVGTGDAFVGAFLARLLVEERVPRALEYAAATAALKRTIAGDIATVTKSEVEKLVEGRTKSLLR